MKLSKAEQVVISGNRIKATLQAMRAENLGPVRVDWLRFSAPLDSVTDADISLPLDLDALKLLDKRGRDLVRDARAAGLDADALHSAKVVSRSGAHTLVNLLGCLEVGQTEDRGMDFYSVRTALMHAGEVVGYVLAGAKSLKQASTVHFNLFGSAMLQIPVTVLPKLRQWIEKTGSVITRADLAFDVFEGLPIESVREAYLSGGFDVRGKRPGQREHGSWTLGHSRTFEIGSRDTGKMIRVYEKGHELFGHQSGDPWVRAEVEYRNNLRVIDPGVLDRPADFFAGAYPWCASLLEEHGADMTPESIKTATRDLKDKTAEAAVSRVCRWVKCSAAPAIYAFMNHAGEEFVNLVLGESFRLPGRLKGFTPSDVQEAFQKVAAGFAPAAAVA